MGNHWGYIVAGIVFKIVLILICSLLKESCSINSDEEANRSPRRRISPKNQTDVQCHLKPKNTPVITRQTVAGNAASSAAATHDSHEIEAGFSSEDQPVHPGRDFAPVTEMTTFNPGPMPDGKFSRQTN